MIVILIETLLTAPDLVIEKTVQTSSTLWIVKVKKLGPGDAKATTLKMAATPGGEYSCPVAPIKAGGTAGVPCKMPFKAQVDMRCVHRESRQIHCREQLRQ